MEAQLKELRKRRERLFESLQMAQKARNEADSKMQSRYDTQKEDAAQDVAMYEALIAQTDQLIEKIQVLPKKSVNSERVAAIGSCIKLEFEDGEEDIFLLLDEMGGVDLNGIETLSTKSPVGSSVIGKREGESILIKLADKEVRVKIVSVD